MNRTPSVSKSRVAPQTLTPVSVSVLIVTYNSSTVLADCLNSIASDTNLDHEIILVDNASQDNTLDLVRLHYSIVKVIENQQNFGFAVGVNQASQAASGTYYLLLNPDTILHPGAIDRLVTFLNTNPLVGISAPRSLTCDGHIRHNCFHFETPWSFFWFGVGIGPLRWLSGWMLHRSGWNITANVPQVVEAVTGAVMIVRRDLFHRLSGLDERFFMYCEDGDFCYRAWQAGLKTVLVPDAVVTHIGGVSTPRAVALLNGMIGRYLLHSRYRYTCKYWGPGAMLVLRLAYALAGAGFILAAGLMPTDRLRSLLFRHGKLLWGTAAPRSEYVQ